MDESAAPAGGGPLPTRCVAAWRAVDDAVRSEVLEALDGLVPGETVAAWSHRLERRAAVTDTALRELRDSYLALAAHASRARLAPVDPSRAPQ